MADELISRQAALARISALMKQITPLEENRNMFFHDSGINGAITGALIEVRKLPAVDAVPVVRCEDCKKNPRFSKTSGKHKVWCRKWRCEVKDTDFCSYGERREENAAD